MLNLSYYTKEEAAAVNNLARLKKIQRLLNDILIDLQICKIEGWDKSTYISDIKKEIDYLYFTITKNKQ